MRRRGSICSFWMREMDAGVGRFEGVGLEEIGVTADVGRRFDCVCGGGIVLVAG